MVKVTNLEYYLNQDLKAVIDLCIKRHAAKWDNLIIIDGDERAGKSTVAKSIGYYYAHTLKKKFSEDNIFFDPDDMINCATQKRDEVIIWDEAALGGLSSQWQSKVQLKLTQMLMIAGKYGHFYIFIIPSYFKLTWYLAVHRSLALIHIYSPDQISRGGFTMFNKKQKAWLYNNHKKSEMYSDPTFSGSFTVKNTEKILDEDAYERKKDAAIIKFMQEEDKSKDNPRIKALKWLAATKLNEKEARDLLKIDRSTYYEWKNIDIGRLFASESGAKSFVPSQKGKSREEEDETAI